MYKQNILKNNVRLLTVPMRGTKTITILVIVKTGSRYEDKDNNGISHFLEHMFFKGTKKRPSALAIAGELDGVGGEFNAFTSQEYTGYWVKVDREQLKLAADVVSDMLLNSKFSDGEINRERGTIIEEINMYYDNPIMYIEFVFESCLYGDTPAGRDVLGTKENILGFGRQDIINYFNSHYSAANTVVCVAGNLKPGSASMVNKYFSRLKDFPVVGKEAVSERQTEPEIKLHHKKTDQVAISLGVRTFPVNHRDEFIVKLIAVILGGSMSSRLFTELREKKGLAYYVRTQAEFYTDSGYLTTQAGVPANKVKEAVKIILSEYKKIKNTLVNAKELIRNRDLIRGRATLQLESSDNLADWYARQAILRSDILTPEEFFNKIDGVQPRDIRRVARDIFVNRGLNLAIIGPFRNKDKFERMLKL